MIVGGCTGGTAGGIKIPRLIFFVKNAKQSISKALNPRKNCYVQDRWKSSKRHCTII